MTPKGMTVINTTPTNAPVVTVQSTPPVPSGTLEQATVALRRRRLEEYANALTVIAHQADFADEMLESRKPKQRLVPLASN